MIISSNGWEWVERLTQSPSEGPLQPLKQLGWHGRHLWKAPSSYHKLLGHLA